MGNSSGGYGYGGQCRTGGNRAAYGSFLQCILDFLIIAFSLFVVMRLMMKAHKKMESLRKKAEQAAAEEAAAAQPAENELAILKDIRDLLQKN